MSVGARLVSGPWGRQRQTPAPSPSERPEPSEQIGNQCRTITQRADGDWDGEYIYRYRSGLQIKNRGLTTAIALRAIEEYTAKFVQ